LPGQTDHGVADDGDDDGQDAFEQPGARPCRSVPDVGPRQGEHHHHGGRDEGDPAEEESGPAGAALGEHDGDLGRGRAGQQACSPDQVEELLLVDPLTFLHQL
jgi:hypothetical protein